MSTQTPTGPGTDNPPEGAVELFVINIKSGSFVPDGEKEERHYANLQFASLDGVNRDGFLGASFDLRRNKLNIAEGLFEYVKDRRYPFPGRYYADVKFNPINGSSTVVGLWPSGVAAVRSKLPPADTSSGK